MMKRLGGWLCLMLVLAPLASADLPAVPPDGGGIKWSTLKLCVRTVQTPAGPRQEPVTWDPWGDGYIAYGYEVELERPVVINGRRITKIKVWAFPLVYWPPSHLSWCHGQTFDLAIWNPAGNEVPAILAAGWDEYDWAEAMAEGEIIVYFKNDGSVAHSATANGDGTFTSKNGMLELESATTKVEMDRLYLRPGVTTRCYRDRPATGGGQDGGPGSDQGAGGGQDEGGGDGDGSGNGPGNGGGG